MGLFRNTFINFQLLRLNLNVPVHFVTLPRTGNINCFPYSHMEIDPFSYGSKKCGLIIRENPVERNGLIDLTDNSLKLRDYGIRDHTHYACDDTDKFYEDVVSKIAHYGSLFPFLKEQVGIAKENSLVLLVKDTKKIHRSEVLHMPDEVLKTFNYPLYERIQKKNSEEEQILTQA